MALDAHLARTEHGLMTNATDPLAGSWFMSEMPAELRATLVAIGEVSDQPAGTVLVRAGVPSPALGVILRGRVAIRPSIPGLGARTILTLEDGDIFGWSTVLGGANATSDAVTIADSQVMLFERSALLAALDAEPRLAAAVYRRVLEAVARRLQWTRLQLLDLYRVGNEPW
jgi:CRP-like cAMP-binding protein